MPFSPSLVLTQQALEDPNAPRLCWINYVQPTNITASSELAAEPASNLGNPSTAFAWQSDSIAQQDIDIDIGGAEVDYVGIARHNLEVDAEIRIQVLSGGIYSTLFDWSNARTAQAILFLFSTASPEAVRVSIRNNPNPPRVAVIYVGVATKFQRNIYVGHTPIVMGRNITEVGGFSESGQYLGSVTRRESFTNSVDLKNLTPSYYRQFIDPFINRRNRTPAFFSWRPESYALEVGYVWITGNPKPSNQRANGMMQITFNMEGIV